MPKLSSYGAKTKRKKYNMRERRRKLRDDKGWAAWLRGALAGFVRIFGAELPSQPPQPLPPPSRPLPPLLPPAAHRRGRVRWAALRAASISRARARGGSAAGGTRPPVLPEEATSPLAPTATTPTTNIEPPKSLTCSLSLELFSDPVVLADGQSYERENIEEWLAMQNTSPLTGNVLNHVNLVPNVVLRQVCEDWKAENPSYRPDA